MVDKKEIEKIQNDYLYLGTSIAFVNFEGDVEHVPLHSEKGKEIMNQLKKKISG